MRVAFTLSFVVLAALLRCREMAFGEGFKFIVIVGVNTGLSVTIQVLGYLDSRTGFSRPPFVVWLDLT